MVTLEAVHEWLPRDIGYDMGDEAPGETVPNQ